MFTKRKIKRGLHHLKSEHASETYKTENHVSKLFKRTIMIKTDAHINSLTSCHPWQPFHPVLWHHNNKPIFWPKIWLSGKVKESCSEFDSVMFLSVREVTDAHSLDTKHHTGTQGWTTNCIYSILLVCALSHTAALMSHNTFKIHVMCLSILSSLIRYLSGHLPWKTESEFMTKQRTGFRNDALQQIYSIHLQKTIHSSKNSSQWCVNTFPAMPFKWAITSNAYVGVNKVKNKNSSPLHCQK